jgi:hypothetical protein
MVWIVFLGFGQTSLEIFCRNKHSFGGAVGGLKGPRVSAEPAGEDAYPEKECL